MNHAHDNKQAEQAAPQTGQQTDWEQRYRLTGDELLFGATPNHFLCRESGNFPAGGKLLAVSEGEGRNALWLAQQGFQVCANDISPTAINRARAQALAAGLTIDFYLEDWLRDDWPPAHWRHAFDGAAAVFIQFANRRQQATQFAHLHNVLRPGGVLLLQGFALEQLQYQSGGPPFPEYLYDEQRLHELLHGWHIEKMEHYEHDISEGPAHTGRASLWGVVATKI